MNDRELYARYKDAAKELLEIAAEVGAADVQKLNEVMAEIGERLKAADEKERGEKT